MDRRLLLEGRLDLGRVGGGDRLRVERAEALLQPERACERLLHGHLLVECDADEQREGVGREQAARLVVVGEIEGVGRSH